jgi:hypothetical protein
MADGNAGTPSVAADEPVAKLTPRPFREGDEGAVIEMFRVVFGRELSLEEWRWRYRGGPHGPAHIYVLESETGLVGHGAFVPGEAWVQGERLRVAYGDAMMVLPEYRGVGAAGLLIRTIHGSEHGFDLNIGHTNKRSTRVMTQNTGTVALGHTRLWIRRHTCNRKWLSPLRNAAALAQRGYAGVAVRLEPSGRIEELEHLGPEIDALAVESATFAPCIRIRSAADLRWRWVEHPHEHWRIRGARERGGRLQGLIVFGVRQTSDGPEGVIVDVLARDYDTTRALVVDASEALFDDDCQRVLCEHRDPRSWGRRAMLRSGFLPGRRGTFMACGALSPAASGVVEHLGSWYLTTFDTRLE